MDTSCRSVIDERHLIFDALHFVNFSTRYRSVTTYQCCPNYSGSNCEVIIVLLLLCLLYVYCTFTVYLLILLYIWLE